MRVYLSLGTNLGDKEQNLKVAVQQINERIGHVAALSAFYITEPWGFESSHSFLNAALIVDTELSPLQVLALTQSIECQLGRTLKSNDGVYHDRLIDIDLLMCDDMVYRDERLTLPHPLMHDRLFVLEPLTQIAPDVMHPLQKLTIKELMLKKQVK